MKRYTGQQALYEAISRSRAKAKQGSILERLRPETSKPESPAVSPPLQIEPEQAAEPVVQEPPEPQVIETSQQPAADRELLIESMLETPPAPVSEMTPEPVERVEPVVKPRPVERLVHPVPPSPMQTWLRPRPVQLNEGRIEVSVPYYVGIIAGLVVLIVILAAFRLGQARTAAPADNTAKEVQAAKDKSGVPKNSAERSTQKSVTTNPSQPRVNSPVASSPGPGTAAAKPQGDHRIVLTQYRRQEDFDPVVKHFAEHGIKLGSASLAELRTYFAAKGLNAGRLSGDGFLLVTMDLLGNPEVPGTDGFEMKQKIIKVGALYKGKAPSGFESFAPNYFGDAYGMKFE